MVLIGLLMITLVAAGCSSETGRGAPTRMPTRVPPTPTPRSTALPEVPTAMPLGEGPRQIKLQIAVQAESPDASAQAAAEALAVHLSAALDLSIAVEFVSEAAAFRDLCSGAPRLAYVSAVTFAEANETCGALPTLSVLRGPRVAQTVGATAEIIAGGHIESVEQLAGETFCRSEEHDLLTTWILPGLFMAARGVDPLLALGDVRDFPDDQTLLGALAAGDCAAASLPAGTFDTLLEEWDAESEVEVRVLLAAGDTARPRVATGWTGFGPQVLPHEVLAAAPDSALPAALRDELVQALIAFFGEPVEGGGRLAALLDASGVTEVQPQHFNAFLATMRASGWQLVASD